MSNRIIRRTLLTGLAATWCAKSGASAAEQAGKVERSGLKEFFAAVEIVPEKDVATYRFVVSKHSLRDNTTWMVGNSPKSDINPALAAGLNAVFLPHGDTWILEHEEVATPQPPCRLVVVDSFSGLREHF